MQKKYRHIYFDLDRTLWDFDSNSTAALQNIFLQFNLNNIFESPEEFITIFRRHNERLWAQYRDGNLRKAILRAKRFELTLAEKKHKNSVLAGSIGDEYLMQSSGQTKVFPGTHEILSYLKEKDYNIYLLTNGFRETQYRKLNNCDLEKYFDKIFISETIGYNKPHKKVFHWAISSVRASKEECILIGDDLEADILGAKSYGIDQVFFNPDRIKTEVVPSYEIHELEELKYILQ